MTREELMEAADLSEPTGTHRLDFLERGHYARDEIAALGQFWAGMYALLEAPRKEVLKRFLIYLPQRGEEGFIGWMQAFWDDGLRGPFFARMLGCEPEEAEEE